jgi:hypothetical protein
MTIHYFLYETRPIPDSEINAGVGGAYVNCWVWAESPSEAVQQAEQAVQDNELVIMEVLEAHSVTRVYYRNNPEGLEHYEEAVREGMCVQIALTIAQVFGIILTTLLYTSSINQREIQPESLCGQRLDCCLDRYQFSIESVNKSDEHGRTINQCSQGIPQRTAMESLGHSDIRLTQNIYTHVFDAAKREAADAVDRLLGDDWGERRQAS